MKLLNSNILLFLCILLGYGSSSISYANSEATKKVISYFVTQAPVIDGKNDEDSWKKAKAIETIDKINKSKILIKSVHTKDHLYFYVTYEDKKEDREHKTMIWNKDIGLYVGGPTREDIFVFKWSMENYPVDLRLGGEDSYYADIWYWKAMRTDHAGFADDKVQYYNDYYLKKSLKIISESGKTFYLKRSGDKGDSAYKSSFYENYDTPQKPRFAQRQPSGSRADIKAKGLWSNGYWHIEFARKIETGHDDDVQFKKNKSYKFGVSLNEIAARKPDPKSNKPLFGSGDISEIIELQFK